MMQKHLDGRYREKKIQNVGIQKIGSGGSEIKSTIASADLLDSQEHLADQPVSLLPFFD